MEPNAESSLFQQALRDELASRTRAYGAACDEMKKLREELDCAYGRIAKLQSEIFTLKVQPLPAAPSAEKILDPELIERLEARLAHQQNELAMQRSMISSLQGEREANSNYLEALNAAGTTSTRLAIARAWSMTMGAVRRRIKALMRRP